MRTLFITGTDTGVGKTHVASLLLQELTALGVRAGAFKPACSGAVLSAAGVAEWDDITRLAAALPQPVETEMICPQRFAAPLAPPLAARREGRLVDLTAIEAGIVDWQPHCDALVVEGAGGWFCPLTETQTFADWVTRRKWPVLIVARRGLGTINHTLLTISAVRQRRLPIVGVILNQCQPEDDDLSVADNAAEIEARSGVPVLGEIGWEGTELRQGGRTVRMNWWLLMSALEFALIPASNTENTR